MLKKRERKAIKRNLKKKIFNVILIILAWQLIKKVFFDK